MSAMEEKHGNKSLVKNICELPLDLLDEICQQILAFLQDQKSITESYKLSLAYEGTEVKRHHPALEEIIRFLLITFRSSGKSNLSADDLVTKLETSSMEWSKPSLQVLHRLWCKHGALVHSKQNNHSTLTLCQLVDMDWKLGMSVSSDTCRSLNSPYVTLRLKIVEPSGQLCQKSFEMTIPQFQNFHKQFKEIAAAMENV